MSSNSSLDLSKTASDTHTEAVELPQWIVRWDGSFTGTKAGLGLTFQLAGDPICLKLSVPVYATDATRCEALGPALAALVLSRFAIGNVQFYGDSLTVV